MRNVIPSIEVYLPVQCCARDCRRIYSDNSDTEKARGLTLWSDQAQCTDCDEVDSDKG